jgi:hypothetical protein
VTDIDIKALAAEFPRGAVSWRAQSLTKAGDKAMALAYIDARDVMERLDAVCGPEGWQCDYPHASAKTVCRIGIKIGGEWVWKSNGAGDSDIEAEKGALSDAFKRAAVLWGIGRYLYAIESPWVPCETYEANGKKHWKRWTADPWSCVRGGATVANTKPAAAEPAKPAARPATGPGVSAATFAARIDKANTINALDVIRADLQNTDESVVSQAQFDALWADIDHRAAAIGRKGTSPTASLDALDAALGGPAN